MPRGPGRRLSAIADAAASKAASIAARIVRKIRMVS